MKGSLGRKVDWMARIHSLLETESLTLHFSTEKRLSPIRLFYNIFTSRQATRYWLLCQAKERKYRDSAVRLVSAARRCLGLTIDFYLREASCRQLQTAQSGAVSRHLLENASELLSCNLRESGQHFGDCSVLSRSWILSLMRFAARVSAVLTLIQAGQI